jgi:hypothetical protein
MVVDREKSVRMLRRDKSILRLRLVYRVKRLVRGFADLAVHDVESAVASAISLNVESPEVFVWIWDVSCGG